MCVCARQSNETSDQALQTRLKQLARQALDRSAQHFTAALRPGVPTLRRRRSALLCSRRAEGLKRSQPRPASSGGRPLNAGGSGGPARQFLPLGPDFSLSERPQPVRAVQSGEPQGQRYAAEEIQVLRSELHGAAHIGTPAPELAADPEECPSPLRSTSTVNGIAYVPFMSVDLRERFAFPVPFS